MEQPLRWLRRNAVVAYAAVASAAAIGVAGCQAASSAASAHSRSAASATSRPTDRAVQGSATTAFPPVDLPPASRPPSSWHMAVLPRGGAVLAIPPAMHLIGGDRGTVSAADISASGAYLMYLNATPMQGDENLTNFPGFRVAHLLSDTASGAREIAASHNLRFLGGTGTCVLDAYVTKAKANHYTELACFVQGKSRASVIVAAAPTTSWGTVAGVLSQAVAAYQVR